jgi:hypothetical protein
MFDVFHGNGIDDTIELTDGLCQGFQAFLVKSFAWLIRIRIYFLMSIILADRSGWVRALTSIDRSSAL